MKKNIISCLLIGISLSLFWFSFNKSACASEKQCYISPIPTEDIVSPTISLMPSLSVACTPTPEVSITPIVSPSVTPQMSPIPTIKTQISNAANANNINSAGSSASIVLPTNGPETGRADK